MPQVVNQEMYHLLPLIKIPENIHLPKSMYFLPPLNGPLRPKCFKDVSKDSTSTADLSSQKEIFNNGNVSIIFKV
jgi:hypothetical protein